jgi:hypothetical protein
VSKCWSGTPRDRWRATPRGTPRVVFQVATRPVSRAIPGPCLDGQQARTQDRTRKLRRWAAEVEWRGHRKTSGTHVIGRAAART